MLINNIFRDLVNIVQGYLLLKYNASAPLPNVEDGKVTVEIDEKMVIRFDLSYQALMKSETKIISNLYIEEVLIREDSITLEDLKYLLINLLKS